MTAITTLQHRWHIENLTPLPGSWVNQLYKGSAHGQPVVLKIMSDPAIFIREVIALQAYHGYGAVRLLNHNLAHKALLMAAITPGDSLKPYFPQRDTESMTIMASLMQQLHQAPYPAAAFPTLAQHMRPVYDSWPLPDHHIYHARQLASQLLTSQGPPVLLHGDLHHENVLRQGGAWVAIDPQGMIGEALYEVGAFMRNPLPDLSKTPDLSGIMQQRIHTWARLLNADPARIHAWAYVQAVLAAIWAVQDKAPTNHWLACVEALYSL